MAQVTHSVHQHIDLILAHLLHAWRYLPQAMKEIDDWDLGAQLTYIEEWTPDEQLLGVLREYERDGVMTADQSARFRELLALVQENRHLLEELRAS